MKDNTINTTLLCTERQSISDNWPSYSIGAELWSMIKQAYPQFLKGRNRSTSVAPCLEEDQGMEEGRLKLTLVDIR